MVSSHRWCIVIDILLGKLNHLWIFYNRDADYLAVIITGKNNSIVRNDYVKQPALHHRKLMLKYQTKRGSRQNWRNIVYTWRRDNTITNPLVVNITLILMSQEVINIWIMFTLLDRNLICLISKEKLKPPTDLSGNVAYSCIGRTYILSLEWCTGSILPSMHIEAISIIWLRWV